MPETTKWPFSFARCYRIYNGGAGAGRGRAPQARESGRGEKFFHRGDTATLHYSWWLDSMTHRVIVISFQNHLRFCMQGPVDIIFRYSRVLSISFGFGYWQIFLTTGARLIGDRKIVFSVDNRWFLTGRKHATRLERPPNMLRKRWNDFPPGLRPGPRWGSSRRSRRPPSRLGRGIPLPRLGGDTPSPFPTPLDASGVSILGAFGASNLVPPPLFRSKLRHCGKDLRKSHSLKFRMKDWTSERRWKWCYTSMRRN